MEDPQAGTESAKKLWRIRSKKAGPGHWKPARCCGSIVLSPTAGAEGGARESAASAPGDGRVGGEFLRLRVRRLGQGAVGARGVNCGVR